MLISDTEAGRIKESVGPVGDKSAAFFPNAKWMLVLAPD